MLYLTITIPGVDLARSGYLMLKHWESEDCDSRFCAFSELKEFITCTLLHTHQKLDLTHCITSSGYL